MPNLSLYQHHCRDSDGALLTILRQFRAPNGSSRFEFLDGSGRLLLTAVVNGPGATEILIGEHRESPFALGESVQARGSAAKAEVQQVGNSTVLLTIEVEGHSLRVIDDYQRKTRDLVFACSAALFLHVHLDDSGTLTLTEKTQAHATLRFVRRDEAGVLMEDTATVQQGECLEELALRCGVPLAVLIALNPFASGGAPAAGTALRLA